MKRAFTGIELLVVIAIIAILAACLFPVFAQTNTAAKTTSDLSNHKQSGGSRQIYLTDHDDTCHSGYFCNNENDTAGAYAQWFGFIQPLVKNHDICKVSLDPTNFVGNNRGISAHCIQVTQYNIQDNQTPRLNYIVNTLVLPRKRRSVDPMNVIFQTVLDEVSRTIVLAHRKGYPSCTSDTSSASGQAFETRRSKNSIKLANGRFHGETSGEVEDLFYHRGSMQGARNRWAKYASGNDVDPTNLKFQIVYIFRDRVKNGANYICPDSHAKYAKPEATVNPKSYQWVLRAYTAGGGNI
ncbi:MAG: prepilin-type N-terminal cleavage/methylation domain-containing protein [Fimbriimonadaceae bacterium]